MSKLIISIISSFFLLFIFWNIQAYTLYGEDMDEYHLDLKRTLEVFDKEFAVEKTIATIEKISTEFSKKIDVDDGVLSSLVNTLSFICTSIIFIIPLAFSLLADLFQLVLIFFDFVFNPKFIRIQL